MPNNHQKSQQLQNAKLFLERVFLLDIEQREEIDTTNEASSLRARETIDQLNSSTDNHLSVKQNLEDLRGHFSKKSRVRASLISIYAVIVTLLLLLPDNRHQATSKTVVVGQKTEQLELLEKKLNSEQFSIQSLSSEIAAYSVKKPSPPAKTIEPLPSVRQQIPVQPLVVNTVDLAPKGQGVGDGVWGVGKNSPYRTDTSRLVNESEKINVEKAVRPCAEDAQREFFNNSRPQAPSLLGRWRKGRHIQTDNCYSPKVNLKSPLRALHPTTYTPHPALRALDAANRPSERLPSLPVPAPPPWPVQTLVRPKSSGTIKVVEPVEDEPVLQNAKSESLLPSIEPESQPFPVARWLGQTDAVYYSFAFQHDGDRFLVQQQPTNSVSDLAPKGQGLGCGVWGVGKSPTEMDTSLDLYGEKKTNAKKADATDMPLYGISHAHQEEKQGREFFSNSQLQAPSLLGRWRKGRHIQTDNCYSPKVNLKSPLRALQSNPYTPHPALRALDGIDRQEQPLLRDEDLEQYLSSTPLSDNNKSLAQQQPLSSVSDTTEQQQLVLEDEDLKQYLSSTPLSDNNKSEVKQQPISSLPDELEQQEQSLFDDEELAHYLNSTPLFDDEILKQKLGSAPSLTELEPQEQAALETEAETKEVTKLLEPELQPESTEQLSPVNTAHQNSTFNHDARSFAETQPLFADEDLKQYLSSTPLLSDDILKQRLNSTP